MSVLAAPRRYLALAAGAGALMVAGTLVSLIISINVGLLGFTDSFDAPFAHQSLWVEIAALVVLAATAVRSAPFLRLAIPPVTERLTRRAASPPAGGGSRGAVAARRSPPVPAPHVHPGVHGGDPRHGQHGPAETLARADFQVARLLTTGYSVWNAAFASLQVAIGAGLIWGRGRTVGWARGISIVWALGVWTIGEGIGGLFMGGTSLLTGAPGRGPSLRHRGRGDLAALASGRGRVGPHGWWCGWGRRCWSGRRPTTPPACRPPRSPMAASVNRDRSAGLDRAVGHVLVGQGAAFAAVLGVVAVLVGLGVLWERTRRGALVTGMVVAAFVGLAGQDLGQVLTGQGTDPGTGPLLILLAVTLWPASVVATGGAGVVTRHERDVEGELFGYRDGDLDPGLPGPAGPSGPGGGRGDATLSRTPAPSCGCSGPGPGPVRARGGYHHPAAGLVHQEGRPGHDARCCPRPGRAASGLTARPGRSPGTPAATRRAFGRPGEVERGVGQGHEADAVVEQPGSIGRGRRAGRRLRRRADCRPRRAGVPSPGPAA